MIRLGIIGTGWISHLFAGSCLATGRYRITAVCSRDIKRAEEFGQRYGASFFFSSAEELAVCAELDAVYIASPNSLHYEQCVTVLRAGKHVIVEKPAFSNASQAESAFALAHENNVILFEAIRNIHEENHRIMKEQIAKLGPICGASLSYLQRSSRYDAVLEGEEPNIFSLRYSGGALMDLGVYLLYDAVDWFGVPQTAAYECRKLRTGVDGGGAALLHYEDFDVVLQVSKTCDSWLPNEVRGDKKAISIDTAHQISELHLISRDSSETFPLPSPMEGLEAEALCFARLITGETATAAYESLRNLSLAVHTLMTKLRMHAGIFFPADEPAGKLDRN